MITAKKNNRLYFLKQEGFDFIFRDEINGHGATGFHKSKESLISYSKDKGYLVFDNGVEI